MSSEVSPIEQRTSDLKISKFSFQWIVKHVSLRTKWLSSGEFHSPDRTSSWKLDFYPRSEGDAGMNLSLTLASSSTAELNAKLSINFLSYGGEKNPTTATLKNLGLYRGALKPGSRIWISEYTPRFISLYSEKDLENFVENCIINDTLTMQCNITIIRESVQTTEFEPPVLPCSSCLVESGEKLFSLGLHSDITLLVEDRKFAVHKNILAAQSPVFASMFDHDMLEKQTGEVKITDFSPEVIEELLRFMYTGNVKNIEKNREELFAAAAKYNLEALKKICEKRLACSLSSVNLYQTLVLAELHESVYLKDATVRFLRRNPEILHDEEFASQLKREGSLAVELCRGLAKPSEEPHRRFL